jgi:hypothetical protein
MLLRRRHALLHLQKLHLLQLLRHALLPLQKLRLLLLLQQRSRVPHVEARRWQWQVQHSHVGCGAADLQRLWPRRQQQLQLLLLLHRRLPCWGGRHGRG